MSKFELALQGYSLTTAEILYHMPDHPAVLQSFIWQEFDMAPRFPALNKFLRFWSGNLDGQLHSVRVAARGLIAPSELKVADGECFAEADRLALAGERQRAIAHDRLPADDRGHGPAGRLHSVERRPSAFRCDP